MNINMPNLILRYGKVAEEFDVFGYMWINIVCQNKIGCYMVVGGCFVNIYTTFQMNSSKALRKQKFQRDSVDLCYMWNKYGCNFILFTLTQLYFFLLCIFLFRNLNLFQIFFIRLLFFRKLFTQVNILGL